MTTLKKIKFTSKTTLRMNGTDYKGYTVGNLPKKFAYLYDEYEETDGTSEWFNYKGLTYIDKSDNPWA